MTRYVVVAVALVLLLILSFGDRDKTSKERIEPTESPQEKESPKVEVTYIKNKESVNSQNTDTKSQNTIDAKIESEQKNTTESPLYKSDTQQYQADKIPNPQIYLEMQRREMEIEESRREIMMMAGRQRMEEEYRRELEKRAAEERYREHIQRELNSMAQSMRAPKKEQIAENIQRDRLNSEILKHQTEIINANLQKERR